MPLINEYKCRKCGFKLPRGWGYYLYVEDDNGERIVCPHPEEGFTIAGVLGVSELAPEVVEKRTGFNSPCVCLDCLHQFRADLGEIGWRPCQSSESIMDWKRPSHREEKDKRECPKCGSKNVKTELELVGQPCPRCKEGVIERIWTGWIS